MSRTYLPRLPCEVALISFFEDSLSYFTGVRLAPVRFTL